MFEDLTKNEIQPSPINGNIPEIKLSSSIRRKLQSIFEGEDSNATIYESTAVVKPDNNYIYFSNHWFYLAVLCKKYAQALYPYCAFIDSNIRNNSDIIRDLANGQYNEEFCSLFATD